MFRGRRFTQSVQEFVSKADTASPLLLTLFVEYTVSQKTKREFSTPDDFYLLFNDFAEDLVAQLGQLGTEYTRHIFAHVAASGDSGNTLTWYKETLYDAFTSRPTQIKATITDATEKTVAIQEAIVDAERKNAQLARLGERLSGQYSIHLNLEKLEEVFAASVFADAEARARKESSKIQKLDEWMTNLRQWRQLALQIGNVDTGIADTVIRELDNEGRQDFARKALHSHRDMLLRAMQETARFTSKSIMKGTRMFETATDFAVVLSKWRAMETRMGQKAMFEGVDMETRRKVTRWIHGSDEGGIAKLTQVVANMHSSSDWSPVGASSGPTWATLPSGTVVKLTTKDSGHEAHCWAADLIISLPGSISCNLFACSHDGKLKSIDTSLQHSSRSKSRTVFGLPAIVFAQAVECAGDRDNAKLLLVSAGNQEATVYTFPCSAWPVSAHGRSKPHVVQAANIGIVVAPTQEEDDLFQNDDSVDLRFTVCDSTGQIIDSDNAIIDERSYYAALTQKRELPSSAGRLWGLHVGGATNAYFSSGSPAKGDCNGLVWEGVDIGGNVTVPVTIRRAIDEYPSTNAQFVCLWSPGGPDPTRPGVTRPDHLQFFSIAAVATYVRDAFEVDSNEEESGEGSRIVSSLDDSATSTSLFVGGTGSTNMTSTVSPREEISQEPLAVAQTAFPSQNVIDVQSVSHPKEMAEPSAEIAPVVNNQPTDSLVSPMGNTRSSIIDLGNSSIYKVEKRPSASSLAHSKEERENSTTVSHHGDGPAGNSSTSEINSGYFTTEKFLAEAALRIDDVDQNQPRNELNAGISPMKEANAPGSNEDRAGPIAHKGGSSSSGSSGGGATSKSSIEVNFVQGGRNTTQFSSIANFLPDERVKSTEDERSVESHYDDSFASEEGLETFLPGVREIGNMLQTWQNTFA